MAVLNAIIESVSRTEWEKYFQAFHGYYFAYIHWINTRTDETIRKSLYKFLIKIDEFKPESNVITAKLTDWWYLMHKRKELGEQDIWGLHGVMIPLPDNLNFIFECPHYHLDEKGFVFIITNNTPPDHHGILMTDKSISFMKPLATATRILLKKIDDETVSKGESYLTEQLGHFQPYELQNEIDINEIENETDSNLGILKAFSKPPQFE